MLAATNRPFDLDEAALRRFTRRIYIPLPDAEAREALINHKLKDVHKNLSEEDMKKLIQMTEGYSGADIAALVQEAAMNPVREIPTEHLLNIKDMSEIRPVQLKDFETAMKSVTPTVTMHCLATFEQWRKE